MPPTYIMGGARSSGRPWFLGSHLYDRLRDTGASGPPSHVDCHGSGHAIYAPHSLSALHCMTQTRSLVPRPPRAGRTAWYLTAAPATWSSALPRSGGRRSKVASCSQCRMSSILPVRSHARLSSSRQGCAVRTTGCATSSRSVRSARSHVLPGTWPPPWGRAAMPVVAAPAVPCRPAYRRGLLVGQPATAGAFC